MEAGAQLGSLAALVIAVMQALASAGRDLWEVLVETGYITAADSVPHYIRVDVQPHVGGCRFADPVRRMAGWSFNLTFERRLMFDLCCVCCCLLGTILDTASIILIVVPLFLAALDTFGVDLVWFGIVTVVGAEIGLLTPPLGISCFVIKSTINDPDVSLFDIFCRGVPVRRDDAAGADNFDNVSASQLGAVVATR